MDCTTCERIETHFRMGYLGKMRNDIGDELIEDAREVIETVRLFRRAAVCLLRLSLGHLLDPYFLARNPECTNRSRTRWPKDRWP